MKEIQPGESFETPKAILSVCQGDVDLMCHRLVSAGEKYMENVPESEQSLPIVFNEYCTTWGNPNLENIESDEEYELAAEAFDEMMDAAEFDEIEETEQ